MNDHLLKCPSCGDPLGLVAVTAWLRTFVRCCSCDLRVPVGWRWDYPTVGSAVSAFHQNRPKAESR